MTIVEDAVAKCGGAREVADFLQVTRQSVYVWMRRGYFPIERALDIEKRFGVPYISLIKPETAQKLMQCDVV